MTLHDLDLEQQELEELAEEIWTLHEEGRSSIEDLRRSSQVRPLDPALRRLVRAGLARLDGQAVVLTDLGRGLGALQVRRHRLAETLFTKVIQAPDSEAVGRAVCVIEHVLDPATTDAVCAFLGHPRQCPHGKAIPAGACCLSVARSDTPLVQPLSRMPPGGVARVASVVSRDRGRLLRLAALGIVPGAELRLQQNAPAVVVSVGETMLALEAEVADAIYVRR
jgi:DtxR family Mn-dependent transcriptional regulator